MADWKDNLSGFLPGFITRAFSANGAEESQIKRPPPIISPTFINGGFFAFEAAGQTFPKIQATEEELIQHKYGDTPKSQLTPHQLTFLENSGTSGMRLRSHGTTAMFIEARPAVQATQAEQEPLYTVLRVETLIADAASGEKERNRSYDSMWDLYTESQVQEIINAYVTAAENNELAIRIPNNKALVTPTYDPSKPEDMQATPQPSSEDKASVFPPAA